jgi:hypothetical protein
MALDPPRVGAGEGDRRDERLCLPGHAGVAGQNSAPPLLRPAYCGRQTGAPHRYGERPPVQFQRCAASLEPSAPSPERAEQLSLPGAVAISAGRLAIPPIARSSKSRRQFLLEHHLNKPAHPVPYAGFDQIKPSRPIKQAGFRRRCAILLHGEGSKGSIGVADGKLPGV